MSGDGFGDVEIIYDPRTQGSSLPIQRAAAMVVYNSQNRVLIVRRSRIVDEFKGAWSFPSVFIGDDDEDMSKTLAECLRDWLALEVRDIRLIGKRMGIRPRWRLLMHLFLAEKASEPVIQTEKYDAVRWVDGREFFSQFRYDKLGECTKAYLDHLRADGPSQ